MGQELGLGKGIRLLMVAPNFRPIPGGVAEYVHQFARHLQQLGDEVTVLTPLAGRPGAEFSYTVSPLDFDPRLRQWGGAWNLPGRARAVAASCREAGQMIRRWRADAVWWTKLTRRRAFWCWALACRSRGVPYLLSVHGNDGSHYLRHRYDLPRRMALRGASRILFTTRRVAARFTPQLARPWQVEVVPPGAEIAPRRTARPDRRAAPRGKVLALGRLVSRKGFDTLIRAMPRVRRQVPEAGLVICGDGPDGERLRELAGGLGLDSFVEFAGHVSEQVKREHLRTCDLLAMPAREEAGTDFEGFGMVYLEAAAYGKPAIAADAGGAPEAVLHGKTGLVVPPDDPDALADAIVRLLRDGELARRLGEGGRRRVEEELNWPMAARRVHRILESVIG